MDIPKGIDEFAKWFLEKKIEVFLGEDLKEIKKEIKNLYYALNPFPKKEVKEGQLTEDEIKRARGRDFKELVEREGFVVNRAGFIRCPFHDERNPSFYISKSNRGICYGCLWSGDIIDFIKDYKKVDFKQAVKYLNYY